MLDLRVLNYFLTVAREESITHAAEALHLSQPTLSRQLRDMEEMLGKELMIRGPRRITLTEEGLFLKKRAEEILSLASHTEEELRSDDTELNGAIRIGSAESDSVRFLMHAAHDIQARYPHLHFHITSGDGQQMMELLDKSLIDMAVVYGHVDTDKYEVLPCPTVDRWASSCAAITRSRKKKKSPRRTCGMKNSSYPIRSCRMTIRQTGCESG